ncbi:tachykinin-like peptides receptor 86C isoform X1 [Vespula pensylvanica]|uniref:tachykinin-like peptides receptor 86C isoform X1 n=1 Tax=Vespula pensylvanica TaxID=30213 RepID=UPI001CBA06AF|nr:tachykinin-like peptides receptor 86C isoform X1 [Vespula pensylvanica]
MESWTDNVNSNQRLSDEIFESSYFDRENLRLGTNCETFWNHKYWNRSSSSSSIVSTSREMGQLLAPYNATGSYSQNTDANQNYRLYRWGQYYQRSDRDDPMSDPSRDFFGEKNIDNQVTTTATVIRAGEILHFQSNLQNNLVDSERRDAKFQTWPTAQSQLDLANFSYEEEPSSVDHAHRRMRTVTNYFLVNLSLADLMMSLLNCAFNFIFLLNSSWPFGAIYCTINNFVAHVTVASSVFTLVVISFDRYMAIMHPLKRHMSRRRTILTLILIWSVSSILASPNLLYSTTKQKRYLNGKTRISCYLAWPDGGYLSSRTGYFYNILFLSMTYLIPIVVMAICYTLMGRKLWGSKFIGELTHNQKESMKSKRKVVKMFISIVTIFAICWFPYQGFFIFVYHYKEFIQSSYVQHVYLSFYWLAMSNSMVNPIIYYWMNNRFRVYFQLIICKCCCALDRTNVNSPQMREFIELHRSDQERCRCGKCSLICLESKLNFRLGNETRRKKNKNEENNKDKNGVTMILYKK